MRRESLGTELTEKTTRAKAVDPDFEKLSPPMLSKVILFRYTPVFQKISISADLESRIAFVGENGSGEITLVKLLTGELLPTDSCWSAYRNLRIAHFTQHHLV